MSRFSGGGEGGGSSAMLPIVMMMMMMMLSCSVCCSGIFVILGDDSDKSLFDKIKDAVTGGEDADTPAVNFELGSEFTPTGEPVFDELAQIAFEREEERKAATEAKLAAEAAGDADALLQAQEAERLAVEKVRLATAAMQQASFVQGKKTNDAGELASHPGAHPPHDFSKNLMKNDYSTFPACWSDATNPDIGGNSWVSKFKCCEGQGFPPYPKKSEGVGWHFCLENT
jgi:hypothetical protein